MDKEKPSERLYSHLLSSVKSSKQNIFENLLTPLTQQSENKQEQVYEYQKSMRAYLRGFRTEVLKDFTRNREYDRRVKKWLVKFVFVFFILLFIGIVFTLTAFILGWGVAKDLSEWFRGSVIGIIIAGAVSLSTIVFKYIFNRTEDVFYKYSVSLYKHIVNESKGASIDSKDEEDIF